MWKTNKFRGKRKGKKKYYSPSEKSSYYAGLKAGKRIARSARKKNSGRRRF